MTSIVRTVATAAIVTVAGCAGSSSPGVICPPIAIAPIAPPALIAPPNGATGVATTGVSVEITYAPPAGALAVAAPDGTAITGGPFVAAQGANGATPPPGAVTSALPPLAAHTTYTVRVSANYPATPCATGGYNGPTVFTLGTFTTQ